MTHLSLDDLRKVDQMTEPSVEEIVAQIEEFIHDPECDDWQMDNSHFRALIASWRERGEALKAARTFATIQKEEADAHGFPDYVAKESLTVIDAALAAEPASGEMLPASYKKFLAADAVSREAARIDPSGDAPPPASGEEIDAAVKIYRDTAASLQGFLYGHRHVIRDLRRPPAEQEVWSLTEENGDELGQGPDYERCHQAMMDELDRIAMRAALASEPASGEADDWRTPRFHDRDDAPPPPPTQGEEERVLVRLADGETLVERRVSLAWDAALRQRADEATRIAYEECAKIAEQQEQEFLSPEYATDQPLSSFSERFACSQVAAAIRARIKP